MLSELLLKILGAGGEGGRNIDKIGILFLGKTPVWLICLAGIALVALTAFIYKKELKTAGAGWKTLLASLRILAALLLLLIILEPVLVIDKVSFLKPYAVILVDDSLSMGINDYGTVRMAAVNSILSKNASGLENKLLQNCRLKVYKFSRETAAAAQEKTVFEVDKNGYSTSLGTAMQKAMDELIGQPVAGMIILSDGGNNSGEDPLDLAGIDAVRGMPVYCVGLGDPKSKKDLIISNVFADEVANKDDIVNLTVTLEGRGFKGAQIPVRLMKKDRVVREEQVYLEDSNVKKEINMNFTADETGEFNYTVVTLALPGEISELNNKKSVKIKVSDDKLKILYLERYPRWQYRYLIRALKRDKNVFLSGLLEYSDAGFSEGNRPLAEFPPTREQLFDYDVIILGDVSKTFLNKTRALLIKAFVEEKGGSLLFMPGSGWSGYSERVPEIESMLPVELKSGNVLGKQQFKPELTREGLQNPFMQLEDDLKANANAWKNIEGFFWAAKTGKEKPGAVVYARYPGAVPGGTNVFLASHRFGSGRVFLISSDELWRWRYRRENGYFYKFFGQLMRWLGPERISSESKYVKFTTDKNRYTAGERVLVNAKIVDKEYNMVKEEFVDAVYDSPGGGKEKQRLARIAPEASVYSGEFVAAKNGENELTLDYPPLAKELKNLKVKFTVEIPNLEFEAPELNEALLKKISEKTGGQYFTAAEAGNIPGAMKAAKPKVTIRTEKDLKDSPLVIIVFTVLVAVEWFLRKKKQMM